MACGQDHGLQIDIEHLVPQLEIDLDHGNIAAQPEDARRVDQIIQSSGGLEHLLNRPPDEFVVGDVALEIKRPPGVAFQALGPVLQVDAGNSGALGQQVTGDIQAHSAAGAGYDCGLPLETHANLP